MQPMVNKRFAAIKESKHDFPSIKKYPISKVSMPNAAFMYSCAASVCPAATYVNTVAMLKNQNAPFVSNGNPSVNIK